MKKPWKNEERRRSTQALHEHDGEQKSCASDAQTDSDSSCSNNGCRKVSHEDIELAQSLIERCLHLYMTRDEVVAILVNRAKLEPGFTKLVWQKLEEENAEFFEAYYARLKLKKQITIFNLLLERQHHLMNLRDTHNAIPCYMHKGLLRIPGGVVNSSMGYLPPQLPCIPTNDHTHMESSQYDSSSYMVPDGIPALGRFYPIQVTAADTNEDLQLASDDGNGNISDNPGYSLLTADLNNFEDLGALEHNPSSLFSLSDIDTLLNSPDPCDIADDFIVDADPNQ